VVSPSIDRPASFPPAEIPVESVDPNPHQPRRTFDEAGIAALATSIKSSGLVQPIIVRPGPEAGRFQLIAGERRLRAARAAGLLNIPALVREADPYQQAQMALIENIQREDLNPIDRAQAYRTLIDQLGLTQAELASRLGEDRSSVTNYLRLLDLSEAVREQVRTGQLSLGHAKILAGVGNPAQQDELAKRVLAQDLSVRNLERILAEPPPAAAKPTKPESSAHVRDLERDLTSQLGMRVQVRSGANKGKGRVVIHFSSLDDFDRLLDRLGIRMDS
jgi:ParB family chromosome partitioning protein